MEGANFSNVLENIKSLVDIKKILNSELPKLGIAVVAMKSNLKEIPQIIELVLSFGIKKVKIRSIHPFPQTKKEELLTTDDLEILKNLKKTRYKLRH
jgi:MoaA/NifB/PqqE/SkfB family radical SAM enzyme